MTVGVLLVNTGTPEAPTPDAVREYLRRFLTDPRIAPMPLPMWNIILRLFVLGKRSVASANKYAVIWTDEGSPLDVIHRSLVDRLSERFELEGKGPAKVAYAMSYSSPFIGDGLKDLQNAGCDVAVVLPLYPQGAYSTVGVVQDQVAAAMGSLPRLRSVDVLDHYYDRPRYIEALAKRVRDSGFDCGGTDRLICSYHSIPLKDVAAGDTYVDQAMATTKALTESLGLPRERVTTLFQSRFDKGRTWQGPYLRQTLEQWAKAGVDENIYIICPNFAVDCLETLNEIQNDILPAFDQVNDANGGKASTTYIPCLNDSEDGVEVIADVIERALERRKS